MLILATSLALADDWSGAEVDEDAPTETSLETAGSDTTGSLEQAQRDADGGLEVLGGGLPVTSRSRIDHVAVQGAVKGAYPEMLACYDAAGMTARMDVAFTLIVNPDGGVHDVRLADMADRDLDFVTCIQRALGEVRFPQPGGTKPIEVESSIWFSGPEDAPGG